jgi:hypothetical protein
MIEKVTKKALNQAEKQSLSFEKAQSDNFIAKGITVIQNLAPR